MDGMSRAAELEADPGYVDRAIRTGAERARTIAAETMTEVERRMGFLPTVGG